LYDELRQGVQSNYDKIVPLFKKKTPGIRIIPVEEKVDVQQQVVVPYEETSKIVEKYDLYAVGRCFCRQRKHLIGDPCKLGSPELSCLSFGDIARFFIEHDFMKQISKEEVLKFLKTAEDLGLVHTIFHLPDDPEYAERTLCSCCKCCCGVLSNHHSGILAMNTLSSFLAKANEETCIGCGTCIEKCPMEAITLENSLAVVNEEKCIGCGICAHHCPEGAMTLNRTGLRTVFVPPPRLTNV
jgi:ferredoxin